MDEYWTPVPANYTPNSKLSIDMMVCPKNFEHVTKYLECSGIDFTVKIKDLQRLIDTENEVTKVDDEDELTGRNRFCTSESKFNFDNYHQYNVINRYIDCIARKHSDKVDVIPIGHSHENRQMRVVKVSTPSFRGQVKQSIWIDGGIHAREWISPASVMYILYNFVENYDNYKDIVDNYDIYIMPVMNPDG